MAKSKKPEPFYLVRTSKYYPTAQAEAEPDRRSKPWKYRNTRNPTFERKETLAEAQGVALAATQERGEDMAVYEVRLVGRYVKPLPQWRNADE